MANTQSARFAYPKAMRVDGTAVYIHDKVIPAAAAVNDTFDFVVPGGARLCDLQFQCDKIDTGTAVVFKAGYTPLDPSSSLAASLQYFGAGLTTAQAGGRVLCAFKPIKFEEDVIVRLTVTTAVAGFQAGEIHMIAGINQDGIQ